MLVDVGSLMQVLVLPQGAPHPASVVMADDWTKTYSREVAAFPAAWVRASKFWPTTGSSSRLTRLFLLQS